MAASVAATPAWTVAARSGVAVGRAVKVAAIAAAMVACRFGVGVGTSANAAGMPSCTPACPPAGPDVMNTPATPNHTTVNIATIIVRFIVCGPPFYAHRRPLQATQKLHADRQRQRSHHGRRGERSALPRTPINIEKKMVAILEPPGEAL
jgi:hypothetical protein